MKLFKEIINRRFRIAKDYELNNDYLKSIWSFYQIYKICLNLLGIEDKEISKKEKLIKLFVVNRDNLIVLEKIKNHISRDSIIIERTINSLIDNEETEEIMQDFYPVNIIGVNLDDRS